MKPLHLHLVAWVALAAAGAGILRSGIYTALIPGYLVPGLVSQDMVTLAVSAFLLVSASRKGGLEGRNRILVFGALGYLFYAFGISVLERVYTPLYFAYMWVFSGSFFVGAAGILETHPLRRVGLPKPLRYLAAAFLAFNPLLFYPLWIGQMLPLIREGRRIDVLYSIYILDLGFVMPVFLLLAALVLRNRAAGLYYAPAWFVKGALLMASLVLGGLIKPWFGQAWNSGEFALYLGLGLVFLALTVVHLRALKLDVDGS